MSVLVWRIALLGVITDLQTRHTLVASTLYFSLSYLRLILCASQITYNYLWILVSAFGSYHRPSLTQTRQDTLLWPLLCAFLWVTCFTIYLWLLMNTCVYFWEWLQTFTRPDKTRHDTLLWPLLCTFPYLWATMLCFLLLLASTEYFSLFPFSAETSAY